VPIGFYLSGAGEIYTIDISNLLKTEAVRSTIKKFQEYHRLGRLNEYLPQIDSQRLNSLGVLLEPGFSAAGILRKMNIASIVGDARKIDLPNAKFDLINSNNTFEHIFPGILIDILKEFKRLLKPHGLTSHQIDMSDHFAHLDKSITIYNYLQFSDAAWNRIDNSIQPQNRPRITDYRKLFQQAGFKILEEISRPGSIEDLRKVKLADKYKVYAESELAVSHVLMIAG
jgi:SAM-dependent methyltransferase